MVALHVMAACGGGKKPDGEYVTLVDLLGREPVRLLPPPILTDAELAEREWEERQAEIARAQANALLFKTQMMQAKRDGRGPEIVGS
jgi:hypothetical protein